MGATGVGEEWGFRVDVRVCAYNGSIPSNAYTLTDPVCLRRVGWAVGGLSPFVVALMLEG